jgi:hypothetical protein
MYVSSTAGLSTWDVTKAEAPTLLGRLALPHFENEDVDLGGNILLISNDAAESRGIPVRGPRHEARRNRWLGRARRAGRRGRPVLDRRL